LRPLPLILSLVTWEKRPTPASLQLPFVIDVHEFRSSLTKWFHQNFYVWIFCAAQDPNNLEMVEKKASYNLKAPMLGFCK